MRLPSILALFLAFAACSGSSVVISDDGGGGSDSSVGDGGGGGGDGGGGREGGGGDGSANCEDLAKHIGEVKAEAQKCCPTCDSIQCASVAQDLCCPISVQNVDKGKELSTLVSQFKASCSYACPAMPCRSVPSMKCDLTTSLCQ
jgi:hypothetical protein